MTTSEAVLISAHLVATATMVGLIWFVQVVHYPLFASVGTDSFARYEVRHQRLTSFVVGPFMAVEGGTAIWLAIASPPDVSRMWPLVGLGLLGVVHASTVLMQVPLHASLIHGFDSQKVSRLVQTNWIRTVGWSIRGAIASLIVVQALIA